MGKGSSRRNENAQAVRENWPFPDRPRRRYVPPEEQPDESVALVWDCIARVHAQLEGEDA